MTYQEKFAAHRKEVLARQNERNAMIAARRVGKHTKAQIERNKTHNGNR